MSAQAKTHMSPRAQAWYDDATQQLETIEERVPANIQRTIGLYDRIYGMSLIEMREKLAAGEIEETYEICIRLQELALLERILARHE